MPCPARPLSGAAQARMPRPRPGSWPGTRGLGRDSSGMLAPVASWLLARAPGSWCMLQKHKSTCYRCFCVLFMLFVFSCPGPVPGMVLSSGHAPETAGGLRSMAAGGIRWMRAGRAYQSALLRVKRVISAGTSMRQEKPDQMPVPLLTYKCVRLSSLYIPET